MYHWNGWVPRAGAPAEAKPPLELTHSATRLSWTRYCGQQVLAAVALSNGKGNNADAFMESERVMLQSPLIAKARAT